MVKQIHAKQAWVRSGSEIRSQVQNKYQWGIKKTVLIFKFHLQEHSLANKRFCFLFLVIQTLLQAARARLFRERKMHSVIREIVLYLMFVWIVLLVAYGHRDPYAHFMTQNMENSFVGHQESPGAREDDKQETTKQKPVGGDNVKLSDVSTRQCWVYLSCINLGFWETAHLPLS